MSDPKTIVIGKDDQDWPVATDETFDELMASGLPFRIPPDLEDKGFPMTEDRRCKLCNTTFEATMRVKDYMPGKVMVLDNGSIFCSVTCEVVWKADNDPDLWEGSIG